MMRTSLILFISAAACATDNESSLSSPPSRDAIGLALRHQPAGVRPDLELAAVFDEVLARGAEVTPGAPCARILPAFGDRVSLTLAEPEASAWRGGELVTGNIALDTLVADYVVTAVSESSLRPNRFIVDIDATALIPGVESENQAIATGLRTDRLAELFDSLEAVSNAAPELFDADGPDIELSEPDPDTWELLYKNAWGDCISGGCRFRYFWRTRVPRDPSLSAELLEHYGNVELPDFDEFEQTCLPEPPDPS